MGSQSRAKLKTGVVRHFGPIVATALFLLGAGLIANGMYLATDEASDDMLLNLGTEIVGIAVTVGLVDLLIAWRNRQEHSFTVRPAVQEVIGLLGHVERSYQRFLTGTSPPKKDGLDRYASVLRQASSSCLHLGTLVGNHEASVATQLTTFTARAETLLDYLESAIDALVSASVDYGAEIARVRTGGQQLQTLTGSLVTRLRETYELALTEAQAE